MSEDSRLSRCPLCGRDSRRIEHAGKPIHVHEKALSGELIDYCILYGDNT